MKRLKPDKLHVRMVADAYPGEDWLPRCYTLTHSDRTGDLFLTVDSQYDENQVAGWYTRLMRDEVLAEWLSETKGDALHVHCHVSGGLVLGKAAWRDAIFRRELPLVLEALRHGDRGLYRDHRHLDRAPVLVHFHSSQANLDRVEQWGVLDDYR